MNAEAINIKNTAQLLTDAYLVRYPAKAAREIAKLNDQDAGRFLATQPVNIVAALFAYLPAGVGERILPDWEQTQIIDLLVRLDVHQATSLLARVDTALRETILANLDIRHPAFGREFRDILAYPSDTAGRLMDASVEMFHGSLTVAEVLHQIRLRRPKNLDALFLVDMDNKLCGSLEISAVILADDKVPVQTIARPVTAFFNTLDSKDEVIEKFEGSKITSMPVLDITGQVAGIIRDSDVYQQTKQDLVSDMASMVGASKDEMALSSSWFAVRKRMPWLQINLLTAFTAASVVGMFEQLIAQFTALAILLPVVAGQCGNAGAQALAVTMRGLTLKEITIRHWWRVFQKESLAGFLNGIAIAITCSIAVWLWSGNLGLALVMILAMIVSLTIACGSGALVPIVLKRFGLDPAQSSSIVLTTITDIVGFMSFLGIATLLSGMLPVS